MACAAIGAPVCGFAADTYTRRVGCRWPAESLTRMLLRYPLVALVRATRWAAIEGAPGLTRGLVEIGEALRIEALGSRQTVPDLRAAQ